LINDGPVFTRPTIAKIADVGFLTRAGENCDEAAEEVHCSSVKFVSQTGTGVTRDLRIVLRLRGRTFPMLSPVRVKS
jgi:hypothetical protein